MMAFNWFKKKDISDKSASSEVVSQTEPPPGESGIDVSAPEGATLLSRLKSGLSRTRRILTTDIDKLFAGKRPMDDDLLEELEEILITADIGVQTAGELIQKISSGAGDAETVKAALKHEMLELLTVSSTLQTGVSAKPWVMMVVGVNGAGKTTTIGKLASQFTSEGKKVLIAAADTFRAAAVEQLQIWAERSGATLIRHKANADPAAVAFDAVEAAVARDADIVIVDTAGRLHTRVNLMEELKKIRRAITKKIPEAPHETLLVLDATTGQNAIMQARLFHESIGVTALALTKLDGTARGGIVISICHELNLPLKYIGTGENIEDLQAFDPKAFVDALL